MRGWLARGAAISVLTAVLACSSLGTCWLTFAPRGHSCCESGAASIASGTSSCASPAIHGAVAQPDGPVDLAGSFDRLVVDPMHRPRAAALLPVLSARTPPLVLRI